MAWVLLGVAVLLLALTAVYVAAEFALVTVDRAAVDRAAQAGEHRGRAVRRALRKLSTQLSGAQVGITLTTLALGYVMQPSLAALLTGPLARLGLTETAAASVSIALALVVATVLSMLFGELVPKNVAIADPMATARVVVGPLRLTTMLSRPLIWVLNGTANGVLRIFGIAPQEELRAARSASELGSLLRRSAAHGTMERRTAQILAQSLLFSGKAAADVLTPRVDMAVVRADDSADLVIDAALRSGFSRFPVIGQDADDVVGLVHLKRVVAVPPEQRSAIPVRALMVPAPVLPATLPLDDVLELLRGHGLQMAVVADEYGGTAGIVTLEDVVEELVGEIADEHDPKVGRPSPQPDGTWVLPGSLRPDEIAEFTGLTLPEPEEYETVAGLVIERLDRMPQVGDTVLVTAVLRGDVALGALAPDRPIPAEKGSDLGRAVTARLTARRVDGRRLVSVQISAGGPEEGAEPGTDENGNPDPPADPHGSSGTRGPRGGDGHPPSSGSDRSGGLDRGAGG